MTFYYRLPVVEKCFEKCVEISGTQLSRAIFPKKGHSKYDVPQLFFSHHFLVYLKISTTVYEQQPMKNPYVTFFNPILIVNLTKSRKKAIQTSVIKLQNSSNGYVLD